VEIIPSTVDGIDRAADYIRSGRLVAWPSPLSYGLSANALDETAVKRLYQAKRRPASQALIMTVLDLEDARRYGEFNPAAEKLAREFWPGLLSILVDKKPGVVPGVATAGLDTIVLICMEGYGHELLARAGVPMVASSANVSGSRPALSLSDVEDFAGDAGDDVDAVVDGPVSPFNQPTTIVDTTVTPPRILREGVVHIDSVRRVLPDIQPLDRD
jgi:L-threonylcarbamoyladenylate synthase